MIQFFINTITSFSADLWIFVGAGLGIIALAFMAAVVLTFAGGDVNKFKKAAKSLNTNPTHENAAATSKQMPVKVARLYNQHRQTGARPGDAIGIDAAIYSPYQASFAAKAPMLVLLVSIFAVLIAAGGAFIASGIYNIYDYGYGYSQYFYAGDAFLPAVIVAILVSIVGLLFSVIALVLSKVYISGAVKSYNDYIDTLEKLAGGASFANTNVGVMPITKEIEPAVQDIPSPINFNGGGFPNTQERQSPPPSFIPSEPVISFGVSEERETIDNNNNPYAPQYDFSSGVLEPKTVEKEPATAEPIPTTVAPISVTNELPQANEFVANESPAPSFNQVEVDPFITTEKTAIDAEMATPNAKATPYPTTRTRERQSLDAMREKVAAAREARTAAYGATVAKPATPKLTPKQSAANTEELLQKIGRAIEDEAPLATLKELALKLQQERAKTENKTPDRQKKLSETQIKLMRAMTGAMKR